MSVFVNIVFASRFHLETNHAFDTRAFIRGGADPFAICYQLVIIFGSRCAPLAAPLLRSHVVFDLQLKVAVGDAVVFIERGGSKDVCPIIRIKIVGLLIRRLGFGLAPGIIVATFVACGGTYVASGPERTTGQTEVDVRVAV